MEKGAERERGLQDCSLSCRYLREEQAEERKLGETTQKTTMQRWKNSEGEELTGTKKTEITTRKKHYSFPSLILLS